MFGDVVGWRVGIADDELCVWWALLVLLPELGLDCGVDWPHVCSCRAWAFGVGWLDLVKVVDLLDGVVVVAVV